MAKQLKIRGESRSVAESNPIHSDYLLAVPEVRRIPQFLEFARWCAVPSWHRECKTQKEFADSIGVSQDTLTDWKRYPEFWPLVWQLVRERVREQIPDAVEGLYEKIVSGKGGAADVQFLLHLVQNEQTSKNKK